MNDRIGFLINGFSNGEIVSAEIMKDIISMNRVELIHAISNRFHGGSVDTMKKRGYSENKIDQIVYNIYNLYSAARGSIDIAVSNDISEFNVRTIYKLLDGIINGTKIPEEVLVKAVKIEQEEFMYIFKAFFERKSEIESSNVNKTNIDDISRINSATIHRVISYEKMQKSYEEYRDNNTK